MTNPNTVVTVVTKATKGLATQVSALTKTMQELQTLQAMVPELADEISLKSAELAQIEVDIKEAARKAKAELNLQILENEEKVLLNLLAKQKKANITLGDLDDLTERLANAENESQEVFNERVTAAVKAATANHQMEIERLESTHKVETAQLNAELSQATSQVSFYKNQITTMQATIDAERAARIETAKYSQPVFQTGTPTQSR